MMIGLGNRVIPPEVGGRLGARVEAGTVTLSPEAMEAAHQHALRVNANAAAHGWKHKYTLPDESHIDTQIRGFAAEMALAAYLRVPWVPYLPGNINPTARKNADVAGIEVRNSRYENGKLAVYDNDPDDQPVLLVTGTGPTFKLVGWLYASEAKDPIWAADFGCPHYRVPQRYLRPLSTLPKEAAA